MKGIHRTNGESARPTCVVNKEAGKNRFDSCMDDAIAGNMRFVLLVVINEIMYFSKCIMYSFFGNM